MDLGPSGAGPGRPGDRLRRIPVRRRTPGCALSACPRRHSRRSSASTGRWSRSDRPTPDQPPVALHALVGGLHVRRRTYRSRTWLRRQHRADAGGSALAARDADGRARRLGPAARRAARPARRELVDRLHSACTWPERFAGPRRRAAALPGPGPVGRSGVATAWTLLQAGPVRVTDVAAAVGYSPRHLSTRFAREYGIPPKVLARLARFHRSRALLQVAQPPSLATVAAACGFADQAHLTREWRAFAGAPPTAGARPRTSCSFKTRHPRPADARGMTNSPARGRA
jgi:transcriptional regulator GlxA family with amidase domain